MLRTMLLGIKRRAQTRVEAGATLRRASTGTPTVQATSPSGA
jgi:hypothetical protein